MDAFPDVLRIESSGACNFKCIHCVTGNNPNNRGILTIHQFQGIIDQFINADFIPRVVVLYHGGEPLLNKNLEYFVTYLKEIGVKKTVITTNGSLLTEERAEGLIKAGLDELKVSFDGESIDENNYIRRNGNFENDSQNIIKLIELKKKMGFNKPIIRIFNIRICDALTLDSLNASGNFQFSDLPTYLKERFKDVLEEIEFLSYPAYVWPGYNSKDFEQIGLNNIDRPAYCGNLFETISILANGDVVPCCYDIGANLVLGNVYSDNIFKVWNSEKYKELRDNFRSKNYNNICFNCGVVSPKYLVKKDKYSL